MIETVWKNTDIPEKEIRKLIITSFKFIGIYSDAATKLHPLVISRHPTKVEYNISIKTLEIGNMFENDVKNIFIKFDKIEKKTITPPMDNIDKRDLEIALLNAFGK